MFSGLLRKIGSLLEGARPLKPEPEPPIRWLTVRVYSKSSLLCEVACPDPTFETDDDGDTTIVSPAFACGVGLADGEPEFFTIELDGEYIGFGTAEEGDIDRVVEY